MMRTFLIAPMLAVALFVTAGAATAANRGNSGNSGNSGHSSNSVVGHDAAAANSNGIRSLDRDRGLERAADRRNSRSLSGKRMKKTTVKK